MLRDLWETVPGGEWRHVASDEDDAVLIAALEDEPDGSYVICDEDSDGTETGDTYRVCNGVVCQL